MREYKKAYKNYPDAIESLMDCRGDVMTLEQLDKEQGLNLFDKAFYALIGAAIFALASSGK